MIIPGELPERLYDMDHVLHQDGRIFHVIGNHACAGSALAYNLYSPHPDGDRTFRGERYIKNYTEENTLPRDVLETYEVINTGELEAHFDPIQAARGNRSAYEGTIWARLHDRLTEVFGEGSVGVTGSALSGLLFDAEGAIKNDVDFFVEGMDNIPLLRASLPYIREGLGFTDYDEPTQRRIQQGWMRIFRNPNNSFGQIMQRRWSGMQLSPQDGGNPILNTFRIRDRGILFPGELLDPDNIIDRNVTVTGVVTEAEKGILYPRSFTVESRDSESAVYSFWWKFSSPVREGDVVQVCGDTMDVDGEEALRLTNYEDHWIHIAEE